MRECFWQGVRTALKSIARERVPAGETVLSEEMLNRPSQLARPRRTKPGMEPGFVLHFCRLERAISCRSSRRRGRNASARCRRPRYAWSLRDA